MNPENILLFIFLLLLFFYLYFLAGIKTGLNRTADLLNKNQAKKNVTGNTAYKVSIIIPFRNEKENILKNLHCIENQNYPANDFEVIYVNDCSTDGSAEMLSENLKYHNIKIINTVKNQLKTGFKKAAVKQGIDASSGEIIVTADTDTIFGKNWIRSIAEKFDNETGLVAGPVNIFCTGSFLSAFEALEFAGLVMTGAGLIGINKPVICNGANLAYRKKAFDQVNGFSDHLHLSSGEDELLMQSIWSKTSYKIIFSWDPESLVTTYSAENWGKFFQQRKRWASKSFYYSASLRFKLILIFLFYLGIPVQIVLGLFFSEIFLISLLFSLTAKFIFEYLIIIHGRDFLFPKKILKYFIPAEFLQIPYIIISAVMGAFGNFKWKERKLRR